MRVLLLVLSLTTIVSCQSPEAQAAWQDVNNAQAAALEDNVVTDEELANIKELIAIATQTSKDTAFDWKEIGAAVLGTAIFTFTGIRIAPNSWTLGKKQASKLETPA